MCYCFCFIVKSAAWNYLVRISKVKIVKKVWTSSPDACHPTCYYFLTVAVIAVNLGYGWEYLSVEVLECPCICWHQIHSLDKLLMPNWDWLFGFLFINIIILSIYILGWQLVLNNVPLRPTYCLVQLLVQQFGWYFEDFFPISSTLSSLVCRIVGEYCFVHQRMFSD